MAKTHQQSPNKAQPNTLIKEESMSALTTADGKTSLAFPSHVVIEQVQPQVDGGAFPTKKVVGEPVTVTASIHCDGHNHISAQILFKKQNATQWSIERMNITEPGLDQWAGQFIIEELEPYEFTIEAWIDNFDNWKHDTQKKLTAGQDIALDLSEGAGLLLDTAKTAKTEDAGKLRNYAAALHKDALSRDVLAVLSDKRLDTLMFDYAARGKVCRYEKTVQISVEPKRALYGAWYELFPRSASEEAGVHGTFKDVAARLPYIAAMGFDVVYLPPVHPIGTTARKGPNNSLRADATDTGSPWAIGAKEGGHKSVHPQLGTLKDFDQLVAAAKKQGIDIALDIAYQCSPDHPYVTEHPEWFYHRADGSIRCAENPPKKYEDIYPLNFDCDEWQSLWHELKDIIDFWIGHGVSIFRVDNPHTKPYSFWHWLIAEVKKDHPEAIFLAEAFARPKIMKYLGKEGFSQSYTYFTWRLGKQELMEYFNELYHTDVINYLRPNLFANTPDILTHFLQHGGRASFMIRLALAATLGATYGIYGPPFELCVGNSLNDTEEYFDSEKYQLRNWNLKSEDSISEFIERINRIRRENEALHNNESLRFLNIQNEGLIAFSKRSYDGKNIIVTIVNLDPYNVQAGSVQVPMGDFGLKGPYQAHELVTNARYHWQEWNWVRLDPYTCPVHIIRLENLET
jgi:starch synthase (maltosyl-transferring)